MPIIVVWPVQLEAHAVATCTNEKEVIHDGPKQTNAVKINPIVMAVF